MYIYITNSIYLICDRINVILRQLSWSIYTNTTHERKLVAVMIRNFSTRRLNTVHTKNLTYTVQTKNLSYTVHTKRNLT